MSKFMLRARFTASGFQGVAKEGFASREAYIRGLAESIGATVEGWYFVYGEDDVLVIIDADSTSAAAISLAVNQSGSVELSTTPLLTTEEMDQARAKMPDYRAPGQ